MSNDEIILGQMGTDEENANCHHWRESQLKENDRRVASGHFGDIPDDLTEEDERLLTRVHCGIAEKDEQKRLRRAAARKRQDCPACGSSDVARILYGLIVLDEKLEEQSRRRKITFGGCGVSPDQPDRQCNDCGNEWKHSVDRQRRI